MKDLNIKLYKMEVIKGKENVANQLLDFLNNNKDESIETLENEGVFLESYFTAIENDIMIIYCCIVADDIEYANNVASNSNNELDKEYFEYVKQCISQTTGDIIDCLMYIENLKNF